MIDVTKITINHALEALADRFGNIGSVFIDGVSVPYWADETGVWFYDPDETRGGEHTIARFEVETTVWRQQ